MKNKIKSLVSDHLERIIAIRRHLHAHPELSFEEYKTSEYVKSILSELRVGYRDGLATGTGIVAEIGQGDRVVALRADMDALPITEQNEVPYKSQNAGVMHACGHDVHTSSLLGCIMVLKEIEHELDVTVRCIFQPGEERLPGGASMMIADGVFEGPKVSQIIGQHVHPSLPSGTVGIRPDYFMASCDELFISVIGKGGHGALPHETIDPILISAELIQSLQSIISRRSNPNTPSVLTIGKINSVGGATNVIPERVDMQGTFRTFDEGWRKEAHVLIAQRTQQLVEAHDATVEIQIKKGYPSLYNHPKLTALVKNQMIEYLGREHVIDLPPRMTAEDFSYYSQVVPACFYRLGTASKDGHFASPVHTPTFDIDESSLEVSVGLMAWLAYTAVL